MQNFVDLIKQYPGKEQAELRVRIIVPGLWFDNLTPSKGPFLETYPEVHRASPRPCCAVSAAH